MKHLVILALCIVGQYSFGKNLSIAMVYSGESAKAITKALGKGQKFSYETKDQNFMLSCFVLSLGEQVCQVFVPGGQRPTGFDDTTLVRLFLKVEGGTARQIYQDLFRGVAEDQRDLGGPLSKTIQTPDSMEIHCINGDDCVFMKELPVCLRKNPADCVE